MTQYRDHVTIEIESELHDHGITIAFPLRGEPRQTCSHFASLVKNFLTQ